MGINKPKIPIVDFVPDQVQHLHDTDETKIMEDKTITLDKVDIEKIRDDDTNQSPANRLSEDELSENWITEFVYEMKFEVHNLMLTTTSTLSTINTNDIRSSVHNYVTSSLNYFDKNSEHNDWYITPLISLLEKDIDRNLILKMATKEHLY